MNLHLIIEIFYSISPKIYNFQLNLFNGNHFEVLKQKLRNIPLNSILEIGCGTAPILKKIQPYEYIGVDIGEKFINLAKKIYKNKKYHFFVGGLNNIDINKTFDIILFSHTTHHLTDSEIKDLFIELYKYKFKKIVIYDGRPRGVFKQLLTKLDYGAAKFRNVGDFIPLINKKYKIEHMETFRSNRPFYEYQLLIIRKK